MGLRFDPVGGGQFQKVVKDIIESERQPIKQLEVRKSREDARMKLFQDFKSRFSNLDKTLVDFTNFRKFRELKVDLGNGSNLMSVTVDKERAEPGTYEIEIDELAARSSIISNSFPDPDEQVLGIGFVVVYLPDGETREIFVDEEDASLHGVAKLINREPHSPIRASVVRDSTELERPWRLMITSVGEGLEKSVEFPEFYFLDGIEDFYIQDDHEAQNAYMLLDGFEIEAGSNHVVDFLEGVNIDLKATRPDEPFTMKITEDYDKVAGKVKALIDQINGVLEFINKQNQIDEKSDTKTTFAGDTGLQMIEYKLRNMIHTPIAVGDPEDDESDFHYVSLHQIGVEFEKTGMLSFKDDKFKRAMEKDFDSVAMAICGPDGLAQTLRGTIFAYTRSGDGILAAREQGMRNRIRTIDDQIANKERLLERRTQALTDQFSRLQGSLANMQRQGQYLSATLGAGGGGNNLVSQLLGG